MLFVPKVDAGYSFLNGAGAATLLETVVSERGWQLSDWSLSQLDHAPGRSTTATYECLVTTDEKDKEVLVGLTVRAEGPNEKDRSAQLFTNKGVTAAAWIYPDDPELSGLPSITYPRQALSLLREHGLAPTRAQQADLQLRMIRYRPRRRAVVRLELGDVWFAKALRAGNAAVVAYKHGLLEQARVPVAHVAAQTSDDVVILESLTGTPLNRAIFDEEPPVSGEEIVRLLDSIPNTVNELPRRAPWVANLEHYASLVAIMVPEEESRLQRLVEGINSGLDKTLGNEPTHGDLHEGQLFVTGGRITGLLDIDTVGPGRRVDDLACLLAHLSTIRHMNVSQTTAVQRLLKDWTAVFEGRVDATQLRLTTAGVAVSLASNPTKGTDLKAEVGNTLSVAERYLHSARLGG